VAEERIIPTPAPSDRPTFTILIDGKELSREYHIMSIIVTKLLNKISYAKITLFDGVPADNDFPLSNTDLFVPGKEVEILSGYHSKEKSIFKGIVIKHGIKTRQKKSSILNIECKHRAVKMTIGRKNAYYYNSKDSEIFDTMITSYSLNKNISDTPVQHKELVQYNCTDWDFLVSRAEANGMLVFAHNEKIEIKKPDFSSDPVLSLLYGATILEFEAEMDARDQLFAVESQGWDSANQDILSSEGQELQVIKQGNIAPSALADVIGLKKLTMRHCGSFSEEELKSWADAQLLKSRLARIRGRVKFIGYADINPGDILELNGVGERFNGKAFVSGIRHEIGGGLWTTDAQFGFSPQWFVEENDVHSKPASGLLPAVSGLQIGIVTQLEGDPDGEERILVKMPLVNNQDDGVWTRIATLDAGKNRGSVFRPEIGDEVVLGFLNDDPRDPVVLGMVHSSSKPAPLQAKDDNHEKGFITRSQMKFLFDDDKKSITLETPAGKSITVSEDEGSIVMKDENSNTITMNTEGITLESGAALTLKAKGDITVQGKNVDHKASAQFKAEGSAGAQLTTSAIAVVKGSLVQIN
jgi:Rhs element Vgr protein